MVSKASKTIRKIIKKIRYENGCKEFSLFEVCDVMIVMNKIISESLNFIFFQEQF